MNRSLVTLGLVLMMLLPSPAFAWFGWLDKLSGAGPFWGLLFDVRAVCFGQEYDGPKLLDALATVERARTLELQSSQDYKTASDAYANRGGEPNWARIASIYQTALASSSATASGWDNALQIWRASARSWTLLADGTAYAQSAMPTAAMNDLGVDECRRRSAAPPGSQQDVECDLKPRTDQLQKRIDQLRTETSSQKQLAFEKEQKNAFALSLGVEISACKEVRRRSSLDVGVGIWKVLDDSSPYADDRMTTAKTAYTVRLFDWLDYSTSIGAFWITSSNYEAVRGVYFEPARLALHAPSSWSMLPFSNPKRIAAIPVLVWGPVVFPNGFKANAFGTPQPERIKGEAIYKNFAVFFSVHPAARKRNTKD
jgi:hypothetical protein